MEKGVEKTVKKEIKYGRTNFGAKPLMYPQPVLIIGTYDENGVPNAMNETYEAITVKPEDGEIGVNIKIDKAYAEYNDGRPFDMIVRQVSGFAAEALDNHPGFDLNAIQDYSIMKTKLSMEVVSAERNAQLLETVQSFRENKEGS